MCFKKLTTSPLITDQNLDWSRIFSAKYIGRPNETPKEILSFTKTNKFKLAPLLLI